MAYTYDENLFSDLYKDVYGSRPRFHPFWDAKPGEKQEMWNFLMAEAARVTKYEVEAQKQAVEDFENHIKRVISWGANDRKNAIKWIVSAYDEPFIDTEFILYDLNLPFSYKEEIENAIQPSIDF